MEINYNENRQRVRATALTNEGICFWRRWHQTVTIGTDDKEQIVHLRAKRKEEIEVLKHAIEQAVITHEMWSNLQDSFVYHETATMLRTQVQRENRRANTLLFEHDICLKGFMLPEPL